VSGVGTRRILSTWIGFLLLWAVLDRPVGAATMRLSYYLPTGNVTYSGVYPYPGSAACSWNLPLGTVLQLPDRQVVCLDRGGGLGSSGWVDVFVRSHAEGAAVAALGPYAEVSVVRWGWGG
jgi:hypothetical protein